MGRSLPLCTFLFFMVDFLLIADGPAPMKAGMRYRLAQIVYHRRYWFPNL